MKRLTLLAASVLSLIATGSFAYNESDETRTQHDWFVHERMRTEGFVDAQVANGGMTIACPSPKAQKQFAEFWKQLQLTDGVTTPTPYPVYAAADVANVEPVDRSRERLAMNCVGLTSNSR